MKRPLPGWFLLPALVLLSAGHAMAQLTVRMQPEAAAAYERIAASVDAQVRRDSSGAGLLLNGARAAASLRRARKGEIAVESAPLPDIEVPGALVHFWGGLMFHEGGRLSQYLPVLLGYDRHKDYYPEVVRATLLKQEGDSYWSRVRLVKSKVLTAVLDIDFEIEVLLRRDDQALIRSVATRIQEVEKADTPNEKLLPPGEDRGFLWRQNAYWRLRELPEGLYVELLTLSLSRDIPSGLGWIVRPFLTSVPKETIEKTLRATRDAASRQ